MITDPVTDNLGHTEFFTSGFTRVHSSGDSWVNPIERQRVTVKIRLLYL